MACIALAVSNNNIKFLFCNNLLTLHLKITVKPSLLAIRMQKKYSKKRDTSGVLQNPILCLRDQQSVIILKYWADLPCHILIEKKISLPEKFRETLKTV